MSETPAPSVARPRPVFLAVGVAALAVFLVYWMWPAASPAPAPSNSAREQRRPAATAGQQAARGTPAGLEVKLGELQQEPPEPPEADRNPFRFKPKPPPPPPPPPPQPRIPKPGDPDYVPPPRVPQPGDPDYVPPPPPPPPPITLKFIGTMEQGKTKVAIFSDGRGLPLYAAEGGVVLGQYRVVKIQVESVVMEYLDGRGRQTIPMRGQ